MWKFIIRAINYSMVYVSYEACINGVEWANNILGVFVYTWAIPMLFVAVVVVLIAAVAVENVDKADYKACKKSAESYKKPNALIGIINAASSLAKIGLFAYCGMGLFTAVIVLSLLFSAIMTKQAESINKKTKARIAELEEGI